MKLQRTEGDPVSIYTSSADIKIGLPIKLAILPPMFWNVALMILLSSGSKFKYCSCVVHVSLCTDPILLDPLEWSRDEQKNLQLE
jgi:hypothetical protein